MTKINFDDSEQFFPLKLKKNRLFQNYDHLQKKIFFFEFRAKISFITFDEE